MFAFFRSLRSAMTRPAGRAFARRLNLEALEERLVLSGAPALDVGIGGRIGHAFAYQNVPLQTISIAGIRGTYAGTNTPDNNVNDYTVHITWGDGSEETVTNPVKDNGGDGYPLDVKATHKYTTATAQTQDHVTLFVVGPDGSKSYTADVGTFDVGPLNTNPLPLPAAEPAAGPTTSAKPLGFVAISPHGNGNWGAQVGVPVQNQVIGFINGTYNQAADNNPQDYTVQINWGDDNKWYAGKVEATAPGSEYPLQLVGTKPKPYAAEGSYHVVAYVTGPDGTSYTASYSNGVVEPNTTGDVFVSNSDTGNTAPTATQPLSAGVQANNINNGGQSTDPGTGGNPSITPATTLTKPLTAAVQANNHINTGGQSTTTGADTTPRTPPATTTPLNATAQASNNVNTGGETTGTATGGTSSTASSSTPTKQLKGQVTTTTTTATSKAPAPQKLPGAATSFNKDGTESHPKRTLDKIRELKGDQGGVATLEKEGWKYEGSLHYEGNHGLDAVMSKQEGGKTLYGVVENKHGKSFTALGEGNGFRQGTPEYNEAGVAQALQKGDAQTKLLAGKVEQAIKEGNLKSFVYLFKKNKLYEIPQGSPAATQLGKNATVKSLQATEVPTKNTSSANRSTLTKENAKLAAGRPISRTLSGPGPASEPAVNEPVKTATPAPHAPAGGAAKAAGQALGALGFAGDLFSAFNLGDNIHNGDVVSGVGNGATVLGSGLGLLGTALAAPALGTAALVVGTGATAYNLTLEAGNAYNRLQDSVDQFQKTGGVATLVDTLHVVSNKVFQQLSK